MKIWLAHLGLILAFSVVGFADCENPASSNRRPICNTCNIGLQYCQQSMGVLYFDGYYPPLNSITSTSCAQNQGQCSTSSSCPQGVCNKCTVTWTGTCNGSAKSVQSTSCCQTAS
jgi:hypothetical protein